MVKSKECVVNPGYCTMSKILVANSLIPELLRLGVKAVRVS